MSMPQAVGSRPALTSCFALTLAISAVFSFLPSANNARAEGVLILLSGDAELSIVRLKGDEVGLDSQSRGIVIWADSERESWQFLAPGSKWTRPAQADRSDAPSRFHASRGQSGDSSGGGIGGQMTTQLVQILGQSVTRGNGFLTPHNGYLLHPRITIRRRPRSKQKPLPAATAVLRRGTVELARIPFKAGQQKIAYKDIPKMAAEHSQGLAPGQYSLRIDGGSESSTFTIEDADWRDQVMQLPARFAKLTGSRTNPLYLQVTLDELLGQRDEDDSPVLYLSDALDLLESVPDEKLSEHLRESKARILKRLEGSRQKASGPLADPTGIPRIDAARRLIQAGNWREALAQLDDEGVADDSRAGGLAAVYRAVVLGESGLGTGAAAAATFHRAIGTLQDGLPVDRYRAHTNYANILLDQARDRLHNHAFQMATGVRQPLLTALENWRLARGEYDVALGFAEHLDARQLAGIRVNVARLYILLADLIRTLDASVEGNRRFQSGEQAAVTRALSFATEAAEGGKAEPMTRAAVAEIQAHTAFRSRDSQRLLEQARKALAAYLDAGSLAGAEGIHRLLGLYYLRLQEFDGRTSGEESQTQEALRHLLISRGLAELLRERIPADAFGARQAGFFARRAYVNEQIIELFIRQGKAADALRIAEAAKARSLQDLLAIKGTATQGDSEAPDGQVRTVEQLLDEWPDDCAALEYYVGSLKTWLFVVDTKGEVTAFDLLGNERSSRTFVAEVTRFLQGIEGHAARMRERILNGDGFDHSWQGTLQAFSSTLLPQGVLEKLNEADTVIVVPHHVLHYFPFAALVTELDRRERGAFEMTQPRFLIEEDFVPVYAPSLTVWDRLRQRPGGAVQQVAAVGIVDFPSAPRLPGVELDLQNLKAAFGAKVNRVLSADSATEENAREVLRRPGMVLFATHGFNQADRPLDSFLLCKRDEQNDGRLTAAELFAADVRADLVVLSACYSGLADRSPLPGDDLFGIQRALMQSGGRAVVAGLWDVYDQTGPLLMKGFFDELAAGRSAPVALARSQRTFLKKRRSTDGDPWLHPYFWAVYTAAGDDRISFGVKSPARAK